MNTVLQNIYSSLLDLLYEKECPFGLEGSCSLEKFCQSELGLKNDICTFCFNELVDLNIKNRQTEYIQTIYSVTKYLYSAKKLVHKLKWSAPKLAKPISELMVFKLNSCDDLNFDYILAVPGLITEDRSWIPSVLLAREISNSLRIPYMSGILAKLEETKFSKLSKEQRRILANNVYKRHANSEKMELFDSKPRQILLIDDLVTSGSTLEACAKLLKEGNSKHNIKALTFASVIET